MIEKTEIDTLKANINIVDVLQQIAKFQHFAFCCKSSRYVLREKASYILQQCNRVSIYI
jgi:hypothetical protein